MSLRVFILSLALIPAAATARDDSAILREGLLNAAKNERSVLHLAKLCGASPELLAQMEPIATGDLEGMKKMQPSLAKELDMAAADGVRSAESRFAQLGQNAANSADCKQSIALAQASFDDPSAGR